MVVKEAVFSVIPPSTRSRLLCLRRVIPVLSDAESWRNYNRLWSTEETLPIRLKALGGSPIWARGATTDRSTIAGTFGHRYHLPPRGFTPTIIWDLGANIGTTAADFAARYPEASVIAVELDTRNAKLCERNVGPWRDRCTVINAGVWHRDGSVHYDVNRSEEGFAISSHGAEVRALSLNTLLQNHPGEHIFVKMDIEGAEREILRTNTEWTAVVAAFNIEVHAPYTVDDCVSDLARLGFRGTPHGLHPFAVLATR